MAGKKTTETLWLPRLTYEAGGKKFIFLYQGKPLLKNQAAKVFERMFSEESKSTMSIGMKRVRV
jgi:hypothetical protein